jgi:hypothetical protein
MRARIVGALAVAVALAACSTTTETESVRTVVETLTVTATPSPEPGPALDKDRDLCPRAFTLMRVGTVNWSLHKLTQAQRLADRDRFCWAGLLNTYGEAFMSPSGTCAPTVELILRGVRSWRLELLSEARTQLQRGACSDFPRFPR